MGRCFRQGELHRCRRVRPHEAMSSRPSLRDPTVETARRLPPRTGARPRRPRARRAIADLRFQGITGCRSTATSLWHLNQASSSTDRVRGQASTRAPNAERELFMRAVEVTGLRHDTWLSDTRISLPDYLEETGRSTVAFNSPAVHGCLGWKLGEYLALERPSSRRISAGRYLRRSSTATRALRTVARGRHRRSDRNDQRQ